MRMMNINMVEIGYDTFINRYYKYDKSYTKTKQNRIQKIQKIITKL